jgi:uncharacterized Zn finger protein (UPF0148 family)
MSRGMPQQCSVCNNAFMGSDCIKIPIICPNYNRKEKIKQMKKEVAEEYEAKLTAPTMSSDVQAIDRGRKVGGMKCQECGNPITEREGLICDECYSKFDAGMLSDLDA